MNTIIILSTVHPYDDPRVFHRQARSLAKKHRVEMHICAPFEYRRFSPSLTVLGLPEWQSKSSRINTYLALLKRLPALQGQVYILHDPELLPLVPLLKTWKRGRVVYDIHENYVEMIQEKLWIPAPVRNVVARIYQLVEAVALRWVDMIWYPVDDIGRRYRTVPGVKKCRIRNVPHLAQFAGLKTEGKKENLLVCLGYLIDDRGIAQLIEALGMLAPRYPDLRMVFVGAFQSREFEARITQLISRLGLDKRVTVTGKVPYEQVADWLVRAKVGLLNYLPIPNNVHGLPNKLFEYMAAGLPVVASHFKNYAEVVEGTGCGVLVDPTRPEEISRAIAFLLENEEIRHSMGQRGRKAVRERFCWEHEENILLSAVDELLNRT
ncbi:MAG: glycosyltransferase [Calditrichaeota bacterium]|nr:MAG: glycosyltransferase [Calditrichota bacterium]